MTKAAIFDLDGTLLNTLTDLANAGNYALAQTGFPQHEESKYKVMVGNGIPKLIERILPENCGENILNDVKSIFDKYYAAHMTDFTKPYPGIIQCLDVLIQNNIKLAVATNKAHIFSQELIKKYFGGRFQVVEGNKENRKRKPDPEIVFEIMQKIQASKDETVYIGDSSVDMHTAINAGLTPIGVLWGFRSKEELVNSGARYIAENPEELISIIIGR